MNILVIENSRSIAIELEKILKDICPEAEVALFQDADEVFRSVKDRQADIAFIRAELPVYGGMILGRVLKSMFPRINLIFLAATEKFAMEALQLRASGYLTDPVSEEKIRAEFSNLRFLKRPEYREIHSGGNGDFYVNGHWLRFKYSKSRELVDYLIRMNGKVCRTKDLEKVLWESEEKSHLSYLRNILQDITAAFREAGCESLLFRRRGWIGILSMQDLAGGMAEHGENRTEYKAETIYPDRPQIGGGDAEPLRRVSTL